jgi:hypothetical protein
MDLGILWKKSGAVNVIEVLLKAGGLSVPGPEETPAERLTVPAKLFRAPTLIVNCPEPP